MFFLYEYGNTPQFISLYESPENDPKYFDLLKVAKVYLANSNSEKAKEYLSQFFAENTDEKSLDAFCDEQLHQLLN